MNPAICVPITVMAPSYRTKCWQLWMHVVSCNAIEMNECRTSATISRWVYMLPWNCRRPTSVLQLGRVKAEPVLVMSKMWMDTLTDEIHNETKRCKIPVLLHRWDDQCTILHFPLTSKNKYAAGSWIVSKMNPQNRCLLTEALVTFPYEFNLLESR